MTPEKKKTLSTRESNPCPQPVPEPEAPADACATEGDEGGGTAGLRNEEMKRKRRA
jgi:hypothetical protein